MMQIRTIGYIVLLLAFIGSWAGQLQTHDGDLREFWNATFENWQSEFLQIAVAIFLSKVFGAKS